MTQRKVTTSNSKSPKGRTSSKQSKNPSSNARRSMPQEDKDPLLIRIWSNSWGRILYLIIGILVLVGLDLLIAMNRYNLFFTILGVEIIIAMLVGWLVFLILERRKRFMQSDDGNDSDGE